MDDEFFSIVRRMLHTYFPAEIAAPWIDVSKLPVGRLIKDSEDKIGFDTLFAGTALDDVRILDQEYREVFHSPHMYDQFVASLEILHAEEEMYRL